MPSAVTSAKPQSFAPDSPLFRSLSPTLPTSQSPSGSDISLNSVFVPLEAIKPSKANKLIWLLLIKRFFFFFYSDIKAITLDIITCLKGLELFVFPFVFTGKECPVTAYDKDGVRVLLHFATDHPPGRPDVLVIVVSMLNTAPLLVRNVVLQAAVPKVRGTK